MPVRSIFSIDGLNIGKADRNLTYYYGLSDFWSSLFEDSEKIELLLEASSLKLSDIYSKFLQLASTISIQDIEIATSQQVKLVLIKETDAVQGKINTYKLPEVITQSRYIANRLLLPTAYLESGVHYQISDDGTEIQFFEAIASVGFASRLIEQEDDTTREFSLWFVDTLIDEQILYRYFGKLIDVSPQTSTENFKNFIYGLYYLYTNGPNLALLRKGLNLSLGIPLARETETVLETRKYLDTDQWLVITDLNSYLIPFGLEPSVTVGDILEATQELAQWVEVKDYINDGDWWINLAIPSNLMPYIPAGQPDRYAKTGTYADYLMRNFLKKHTFLVNVKTIDFKNLQNFAQLSSIINEVKPKYTYPLYIWTVPTLDEVISFDDSTLTKEWIQQKAESLTVPTTKFKRFLPKYTGYNACDPTMLDSFGSPAKITEDGTFTSARANTIGMVPDTGSYYWEAYVKSLPSTVLTPQFRLGIGTSSASLASPTGQSTTSWGFDGTSSFLSSRTGEKWTTQGLAKVKTDKLNYVDCSTLSYMSTPHNSGQAVTGDLDLIARAFVSPYLLEDATLVAKWESTTNNRAYALQIRTDGTVRLLTSPDGTTIYIHDSTSPTPFSQILYIRATLDVDNGDGTRVAKFYISGNGVNWTQLGNAVTKPGTTTIFNSTAQVLVGAIPFSPTFELDTANTSTGIIPQVGPQPTFTRASTATITDHDNVVRPVLSDEARMLGLRRIQNLLPFSEDFTNAVWTTGDVANPKLPNSTDIAAPDGSFTACKFVINSNAGNRSFGTSFATTSLPNRTFTFSFWVYVPSSNSVNPFQAYMYNTAEVPADMIDLNLLPRNQWTRVCYTHKWGGSATTGINPQFHANAANTVGDMIYVWRPQVEEITGQVVLVPGDYVSTNILSSPYHGANVDGVKYLPYRNENIVQQNIFLRSQEFDNASWVKTNCSILANITTAPDSTLTADAIVETVDGSNTSHQTAQSVTPIAGASYTYSLYAKANTQPAIFMFVSTVFVAPAGAGARFNLQTGTIISADSNCVASIEDAGNGWWRCSMTFTSTTNIASNAFFFSSTLTTHTYQGNGSQAIYVWGAQIQPGLRTSTYVPTTTTALSNNVIEARTGSLISSSIRLGYLSEGSRTNVCLQSENQSTTWSPSGATIGANSTVSPDGNLTADKIIEDTGNTVHRTIQINIAANTTLTYTYSIWVKAAGRTQFLLFMFDQAVTTSFNQVQFDLTAVTATSPTNGGNASGTAGTITAYPNGWYRCSVSGIPNTAGAAGNNMQIDIRIVNGTQTYVGDGASGVYLWGAQVEQAPFASTYIPTTTIAVNRAGDVLAYPIGTWFNLNEGTLYADYTPLGNTGTTAYAITMGMLSDLGNERMDVRVTSLTPNANVVTGGLAQSSFTFSAVTVGTRIKLASAYKLNDFAADQDGSTVLTDSTGTVLPIVDTMRIGVLNAGNHLFGPVSKAVYYPRRISNTGIPAVTTGTSLSGSDIAGADYGFLGKIYSSDIRSGIDGLVAIRFDAANGNPSDLTTISSSTNNTWTFNSNAKIGCEFIPYYLSLLGTTGSYISTPDSSLNSITGDLSITTYLAADNWTPSALQDLVSKSLTDSSQFSYLLRLNPAGTLVLYWSTDGSTLISKTSTASVVAVNGMPFWVRATLDVDNGASGYDVKFFTSSNGITWTQLGTTITTGGGATSIFDSTQEVKLGCRTATSTGNYFTGKIYKTFIRNSVGVETDNTLKVSFDSDDAKILTGGNIVANNVKTVYGPSLKVDDTIGLLYNSDTGSLNIYINGIDQGAAVSGIASTVYPMMSVLSPETIIETNFGDKEFTQTVPVGASSGIYTEDVYLTRDVPYFTRGTMSYFLSGQFGEQSQINGAVRTYEGGIITGYVNSVSQIRPNTLEEKAWYRTEFTRDSESYRNQRSIIAFLRNNSVPDDSGLGERQFKQNIVSDKVVFLYATTQKDLESKFASVGSTIPGLDKWVFTLFSNAVVGQEGINTEGINEGGSLASYFEAMKSSYDTMFFPGSTYRYLGPYMPLVGYQTYAPLITDIRDGDYLLFIRIYESVVGVYWVTSNASLHAPSFRVAEALDPFEIQSSDCPIRRGLAYYSSYYTVRGGGGEFTYAIGMGINEIGINEGGTEAVNPITISYADDENVTPVIVDRNGTVLKFRRDFK